MYLFYVLIVSKGRALYMLSNNTKRIIRLNEQNSRSKLKQQFPRKCFAMQPTYQPCTITLKIIYDT